MEELQAIIGKLTGGHQEENPAREVQPDGPRYSRNYIPVFMGAAVLVVAVVVTMFLLKKK